jgi:hypothetical protein
VVDNCYINVDLDGGEKAFESFYDIAFALESSASLSFPYFLKVGRKG